MIDKMENNGIVFFPYNSYDNKYVGIIQKLLKEQGYKICTVSDFFTKYAIMKNCKIVYLNWYENLDNSNIVMYLTSFVRKLLMLLLFKISRRKIIWTMHNRCQHDLKHKFFSNILFLLLVIFSDRIIIHSKQSKHILQKAYPRLKRIEKKMQYVPHPNYVGDYGEILPTALSTDDKTLYLSFIGQIRPYKNIELLINVIKTFNQEDVHLDIIGRVFTENFKEELMSATSNFPNINFKFGFVPDDSIPLLFQRCDLLVLPYNTESSLNSGTLILGFSYMKSAICPRIGTISDIDIGEDNIFIYDYSSKEEHFIKLQNKIREAISMKKNGKKHFELIGYNMYRYIYELNSKERVGNILNVTIENLLK